jgi:hypothetical protein
VARIVPSISGWSFHPALGASAAYFDDHFYMPKAPPA